MMSVAGGFVVLMFVVLIAIGFIPAIIAHRRKHQNKYAVYAANLVFLFGPFPDEYKWVALLGWFGCLIWSFWKSPEIKVIQGPPGVPGPKGDKGEAAVAMSKAGTISAENKPKDNS